MTELPTVSPGSGRERRFEVYVEASACSPHVPVSLDGLERRARLTMTCEACAYVAGGTAAEETMRGDRAAFERVRTVPRKLRDATHASVDDLGPDAVGLCR